MLGDKLCNVDLCILCVQIVKKSITRRKFHTQMKQKKKSLGTNDPAHMLDFTDIYDQTRNRYTHRL